MDCQINVQANEQDAVAFLPILWADETDGYELDRYGNQLVPAQISIDDYIYNCLEDSRSPSQQPLSFTFEPGSHTISLTFMTQSLEIRAVYIGQRNEPVSYTEYARKYADTGSKGEQIVIEGRHIQPSRILSCGGKAWSILRCFPMIPIRGRST